MVEVLILVAVLALVVVCGLVGYTRLRADVADLIRAGRVTRDRVDTVQARLTAHIERVDVLDDRLSDHALSWHPSEPVERTAKKAAPAKKAAKKAPARKSVSAR